MDVFGQLLRLPLTFWQSLPEGRRWSILASLLLGISAFTAVLLWATHVEQVPLLTNLNPEDAAHIIDRLKSDHVPYSLSSGGSIIMVPEDKVHELRLRLAGEGLPRAGSIGFEIFDAQNFGMSRFAEQLNYRRALEGELRRTIRQLEAVKDARVHIVVPEKSLFRDHEQSASAAVTIQLYQGRQVTQNQVQAIVHLIAASVADLNPDNITVIDTAGNMLAKGPEGSENFNNSLDKQRHIEKNLEERIQQILIPVVGAGHVVARVSAKVDFAQVKRTSETYDPDASALRSEQVKSESQSSNPANNATPGGIPGSRSNLSGGKTDVLSNNSSKNQMSDKRLESRNYEINKVIQHEIAQVGKLQRLSVAVLVDGVSTTSADGKTTVQPRSKEELARLTELVRRAIGFDADREDQVEIQSIPFEIPVSNEQSDTAPEIPAWQNILEKHWSKGLLALLTLGFFIFLVRLRMPKTQEALLLNQPRTVRELEQLLLQRGTGMAGADKMMSTGAAASMIANSGSNGPVSINDASNMLQAAQRNIQNASIQDPSQFPALGSGGDMNNPPDANKAAYVIKGWLGEGA